MRIHFFCKFYLGYLKNVEIKSLKFLNIDCADGNALLYKGYAEVNNLPEDKPGAHKIACLLLVVPDTEWA